MIGQKNLIKTFEEMISNNTLPHFMILIGPQGSGKKILSEHIGHSLNAMIVNTGISVSDIRTMIENSYKLASKTLYVIADADSMSLPAKNAMLKVTEEPPNDAYYILTLEDINNTLGTIKSRGTVFNMERYSEDELLEYYYDVVADPNKFDPETVRNLCETPGEINIFNALDVEAFNDFVNLCVDNVAETTLANSFKLENKLALKESDTDKYDVRMFFKAFMTTCLNRMTEPGNNVKYATGVSVTSEALKDLSVRGASKEMVVDSWITNIRCAWEE